MQTHVYTAWPTRAALVRYVHNNWPTILGQARTYRVALPHAVRLLGSSRKTEKTREVFGNVLSAILYLAPAHEAFPKGAADGRTLCPFATTCISPCLAQNSGQLAFDHARTARCWKTALFLGSRALFVALLRFEIEALIRKAKAAGDTLTIRLDGGSDTGLGARFAALYPAALFEDYTKDYRRASRNAAGGDADNYRVCYSYDGTKAGHRRARTVLEAGGTVSVVFDSIPARGTKAGGPLPDTWQGFAVFDGDKHDHLTVDPRGQVRGLRFKAARQRAAKLEAAGPFVVAV